jgi:hypothetical protein
MMSNQLAEGLFLLAFWAPPLAVLAGALLLLAPNPVEQRSHARPHAAPLTH